jgi:K+-sensing histidine kinase KdpD
LSVLRQISELLARDRVPSEEHRRRFYDALHRESRRLHWLIENLLDFGSMEAGCARYELVPMDVSEFVSSVCCEFQAQLGDANHIIEMSLDTACPRVRGDSEALDRALWNLLDNAVKYSPDSPCIQVETARAEDARVIIRVRDSGLGIPPAEQKEVFRKFVRCELRRAGKAIHLTSMEYKILVAFIRNRGRVLSRDALLDAAWGRDFAVTDRAVDNHVMSLRRKIEPDPEAPRYLVNVRGLGYRFDG